MTQKSLSQPNPLQNAALRYAELGYAVFPCVPGGSQPLTPRGFHDATVDAEQIERWWSAHPQANIGLPTADLLVVDIDGAANAWPTAEQSLDLAIGPMATTPGGGSHGWRFRQYEARKGPVLVIDDTTGSGRSLRMTRQALVRCQSCRTFENEKILASVYCNPDSPLKPDLWSVDLYLPHLLEWNFMNSIVTSVAAFDFDGILCHDAESGGKIGTPLYLPRREPVHIITGRRERDRAVTLAWLKKWHVSVASLTMMANDDQREIAEYKAEEVMRFAATAHERPFGEAMFVESCPVQAKKIAELSGAMVVCPATRAVLGSGRC